MSILSHLYNDFQSPLPKVIRLLYSTRRPDPSSTPSTPEDHHQEDLNNILFFPRLRRIFEHWNRSFMSRQAQEAREEKKFELFLTSHLPSTPDKERASLDPGLELGRGRITKEDLRNALGPAEEREATVAYVCGPQVMTDELVAFLEEEEGMKGRVLAEKWW